MNIDSLAKSELISGLLMISSLVLAICIANIQNLSPFYIDFIFYPVSFGYGQFIYKSALINLVNDVLMTLFFLMIGLELKYHLVLGEYQHCRTLILPTAAAIGGILIPALIYLYFNWNTETVKGWAIPIATDTAFMLGILSFFKKHISSKLRAFILAFSLIDDTIALVQFYMHYRRFLRIRPILVHLSTSLQFRYIKQL